MPACSPDATLNGNDTHPCRDCAVVIMLIYNANKKPVYQNLRQGPSVEEDACVYGSWCAKGLLSYDPLAPLPPMPFEPGRPAPGLMTPLYGVLVPLKPLAFWRFWRLPDWKPPGPLAMNAGDPGCCWYGRLL
jgi:hypothetical protein